MSEDPDPVDKFIEVADFTIGLVKDNKDNIERALDVVSEDETDLALSGKEPLREVSMTDEMVEVTTEVKDSGVDSIRVDHKDGELHVEVGGKTLAANVPDDIIMEEGEANYNNGVLTVRIPREEDGGQDVDVEFGGDN